MIPFPFPPQFAADLDVLQGDFLRMFDSIQGTNCGIDAALRPARVHITTMTMLGAIDGDIKFLEYLKSLGDSAGSVANVDAVEKCRRVVDLVRASPYFDMAPSRFSKTALQIKARQVSAAIKVFSVGNVHVTGVKSYIELIWVLDEMCRLISSVDASTGVVITSLKPAMINVSIATHTGFDLENLLSSALNHDLYGEMPERPPSCNLRVPANGNQVTIMVYKSGKIIVSGKATSDIAAAYGTFMRMLHADRESVAVPRTAEALRRALTRFHWTELLVSAVPGIAHTHGPCTQRVEGCERCRTHGNVFAQRGS
jgi:TATA-box binding protein (TBP) (component of TFIID and TFIIIB)